MVVSAKKHKEKRVKFYHRSAKGAKPRRSIKVGEIVVVCDIICREMRIHDTGRNSIKRLDGTAQMANGVSVFDSTRVGSPAHRKVALSK